MTWNTRSLVSLSISTQFVIIGAFYVSLLTLMFFHITPMTTRPLCFIKRRWTLQNTSLRLIAFLAFGNCLFGFWSSAPYVLLFAAQPVWFVFILATRCYLLNVESAEQVGTVCMSMLILLLGVNIFFEVLNPPNLKIIYTVVSVGMVMLLLILHGFIFVVHGDHYSLKFLWLPCIWAIFSYLKIVDDPLHTKPPSIGEFLIIVCLALNDVLITDDLVLQNA